MFKKLYNLFVVEPVGHAYEIPLLLFPFDYMPFASLILTIVMNLMIFELAISLSINCHAHDRFGIIFRVLTHPHPLGIGLTSGPPSVEI